jgi:hypothetical protein
LRDALVRMSGAFAAGAAALAHSRIARQRRTLGVAPQWAALTITITPSASSRDLCAEPARTRADATTTLATFHVSLAGEPSSKNSLEQRCTSWHTLCFPPPRPAAGRETRRIFSVIAAERRPTTARPKGGRSVV